MRKTHGLPSLDYADLLPFGLIVSLRADSGPKTCFALLFIRKSSLWCHPKKRIVFCKFTAIDE